MKQTGSTVVKVQKNLFMGGASSILLFIVLFFSGIVSRAQIVVMPSMFGVQHRASIPPTIQTNSVTMDDDGTTISATVTITAATGTTVTARGVCYSTSPNPTTANTTTSNNTGAGTYSASLSLSGATIYYIRGYMVAGGTTYYGNEIKAIAYAYSGGVQTFTVPAGVTSATIKVLGAAGGDCYLNASSIAYGGKGASIQGTFGVTASESIYVLIGQKGGDGYPSTAFRGAGGGGGTFVYRSVSGNPMIIAGGGGGCLLSSSSGRVDGQPGQTGTSGSSGKGITADAIGPGGSNGNGGSGRQAGGGAGWLTAGTSSSYPVTGGKRNPWNGGDYMSGLAAHQYAKGGYGGGGSGTTGDGGGGGGYSGGSANALVSSPNNGSGGGGGSINYGTSGVSAAGTNDGHGIALITW